MTPIANYNQYISISEINVRSGCHVDADYDQCFNTVFVIAGCRTFIFVRSNIKRRSRRENTTERSAGGVKCRNMLEANHSFV